MNQNEQPQSPAGSNEKKEDPTHLSLRVRFMILDFNEII